jgi:branched-chain amino acid transport system permease protein
VTARLQRLQTATVLGPLALLGAVAAVGATTSASGQQDYIAILVNVTIVVALYLFVGNSGVVSLGHISFVAVGAFAAGVLSIEATTKQFVLPELFPFLQETTVGNEVSLVIAAGAGGLLALVTGIPLMRLSGLAAGIATFAVLEIAHNVLRFSDEIGPGAQTLSLVPETTGIGQALVGAVIAVVIAWAYGLSRSGRLLRASREDPAAAQAIGVQVHRQRLIAFTVSGVLSGLAGGMLVHQLGSITTEQVYLDLTFLTLAMLVIGGVASLWGAVVGAVLVSILNTLLADWENGSVAGVTLPAGASTVVLGVLMAVILVGRPGGVTGGREFGLSTSWRESDI